MRDTKPNVTIPDKKPLGMRGENSWPKECVFLKAVVFCRTKKSLKDNFLIHLADHNFPNIRASFAQPGICEKMGM